MFTNKEKQQLAYFITACHQSGKDPGAEAQINFRAVLNFFEPNTPPYRLAWSKALGFYVLHPTHEAIEILTSEVELRNGSNDRKELEAE